MNISKRKGYNIYFALYALHVCMKLIRSPFKRKRDKKDNS